MSYCARFIHCSLLLVVPHLLLHFALNLGQICLLVLFILCSLNFSHLIFEVLVIEPRYSLAVLPEACALYAVHVSVYALTVLLAIFPLAGILTTILPRVDTEAMLLVIQILALVTAAVLPRELTLAIHISIDPVALKSLAILPLIDSDAVNLIVLPITLVNGAVGVDVFAATVLGTLIILANVA